jgi:quercetin dioxygenase-like cupin family protein
MKVKTLLKTSTNWGGQEIRYPRKGRAEVSVLFIEMAPGEQTGWHRHPVPLFGYMLSGALTIELPDGTKCVHRAGKAASEVVDLLHNGVNRGKKPCRLVVFVIGKKDVPFVVKAKTPGK